MSLKEEFYCEAQFGGFTDIDGTVAFFNRVNALAEPSHVVLDVGCGRGAYAEDASRFRRNLRILKGKVQKVIGIDVDAAASSNPFLDEFHLLEGAVWPIDDGVIDLIVCDNVMEHIEDPENFFRESKRVLKKGGLLCIRTPNKWSYVAIAAMLIPDKYHSKVTNVVQEGRKEEDLFPTVYRCNTVRRLRRAMKSHGFHSVVYGYAPEPSYLSFSKIAYGLGVLHQKFAPRCMKPAIFAFGRLDHK